MVCGQLSLTPYFGDVLSAEGGAQEAVTSRIRSAWKKFKETSDLKKLYAEKVHIFFKSEISLMEKNLKKLFKEKAYH